MANKKEEIRILMSFISEYRKDISIISFEDAKTIFPSYNKENPDFIIEVENEHIGIELFELVSSINENLLMSQKERENKIRNQHHLQYYRKKLKTNYLYENEELLNVAIERINDKIENKLQNYVPKKVWLLGYANKPFNFKIVDVAIEDYTEEFVREFIKNKITKSNRVEKIFLFGGHSKNRILEIK